MIFFDIDGTLLDYDYAEKEGITDFFNTHNQLFSFTKNQFIELWKQLSIDYFEKFLANELSFEEQKRLRMIQIFKKAEIDITNQEADEKFNLYLSFYKKNWKSYEEVTKVLEVLKQKGYLLGIISNGDYQQQIDKLESMSIKQYFSYIVTSSEVGSAKPNKSIFVEACAQAKKPIEDCYYVGDRLETDALGSKNAGMKGIWINRKNKQKTSDVIVVNSLKELLEVFK